MDRDSALRDYLLAIRRRWMLLVGCIAACLGVALAVSFTTTPMYRATVQLTYERQPNVASALSGTPNYSSTVDVKREIETYANLISTQEMRALAARQDETLDLSPGLVTVSAAYVEDTNVMTLSAESSSPTLAAAAANTYAIALVASLRDKAVAQYEAAEKVIVDKMSNFTNAEKKAGDPAYLALLARQEDVRILKSAATGSLSIAAKAEVPAAPFVPNHIRDGALGLLVGLIVGIGLVALAEQLDIRARTTDDLTRLLDLPVIGRIPRLPRASAGSSGLVVVREPDGHGAEAFRMLRGNLEFMAIDEELKVVLVSSATQSEGKTTTVCNLAITLARSGKSVVVLDADLRRPQVHRYFGARNTSGVSTVVTGQSSLSESRHQILVAPRTDQPGGARAGSLGVLTAGPVPPNPGEIVASRRLRELIHELAEGVDLVLIDSAPMLTVGDAAAMAPAVDGVIVVARLGAVTKATMKELKTSLAALPCRRLGVVATNVSTEAGAYRYRYYKYRSSRDADGDQAGLGMSEVTPG